MAEARRPVSELYPQGGAGSMESTLSEQSPFGASSRSTLATTPSRLPEGPSYTCQEEAVSLICREHSAIPPTREANCSNPMMSREPGEQEQRPAEHCVALRASRRPHSLAETHILPRHHVNAMNDNPQVCRTVQTIMPASLPVHRSHSDTLPLVKQRVPPLAPDTETHGLAYQGDKSIQEAENASMLACKQPMQLQQCNIITTICRGTNSGEGSVQQRQSRCVCISSPKAAAKVEGVEEKGQRPIECGKELCYGSYIHPASFEDTFAAYCHPQPIPAPSQLLPRFADVEPSCDIQCAVGPPSANHLALPRLISSVSETGLDTKHLLRCCNLNCSWISSLPPGTGPSQKQMIGGQDCCSSTVGHIRTLTRDMGTMTTHTELRDVGVQTGQIITPHVFPQICLAEDSRSETSNILADEDRKPGGAPKSPVKEVKWDAEGMTWEVYGASVDPEELGLAIQRHLELQIKETAGHAAKLSHQNTNTSRQRGDASCQKKRTRMMGSIRTPACCTRTTTAVD